MSSIFNDDNFGVALMYKQILGKSDSYAHAEIYSEESKKLFKKDPIYNQTLNFIERWKSVILTEIRHSSTDISLDEAVIVAFKKCIVYCVKNAIRECTELGIPDMKQIFTRANKTLTKQFNNIMTKMNVKVSTVDDQIIAIFIHINEQPLYVFKFDVVGKICND